MDVELARRNDIAVVGQAQERASAQGPELTVVIPTLNERDNIGPLVELLDTVPHTVLLGGGFRRRRLARRHSRLDP